MPTYSEITRRVADGTDIQVLLQEGLAALHAKTGHPVLVYEANTSTASRHALVSEDDIPALMDALSGVKGPRIDLILHSNGGSPDGADMFVSYLRQKFKHVRVFVPVQAMSAATMIACVADEVVLGAHSFLGPIDMQFDIGGRVAAAQDILDQYELIRKDFEGNWREFWSGPGEQYAPDLLIMCQNALAYGREVAQRGLRQSMFRDDKDGPERAKKIAEDLADHQKHRNHGRRLSRAYLRRLGMKVTRLEADHDLQDHVLTIHHCVQHLFRLRPFIAKLVQNHLGKSVPIEDPERLAAMMRAWEEIQRRESRPPQEPDWRYEDEDPAASQPQATPDGSTGTETEPCSDHDLELADSAFEPPAPLPSNGPTAE